MKTIILFITMLLLAGCAATVDTAYDCKQAGWKGVVNYMYPHEPRDNEEQYCSNGEIINKSFVTNQGTMPLLVNGWKAVYTEFK